MTSILKIQTAAFILTATLLSCLAGPIECGEENLLSPDNAYRFAKHLFSEGEYLRAAVEYQRYVYSTEGTPAKLDSALFMTGLSYRLGHRFEKAITYFKRMAFESPQSGLADEAHRQVALCYLLAGHDSTATSYAAGKLRVLQDEHSRLELGKVVCLSHLRSKRWVRAQTVADSLKVLFPEDTMLVSMRSLALEGEHLPHKSSLLAGFYSAAIPGAGRLYVGRPADGIFSFLAVSLTSWQAYEAFDEHGSGSVKGWVYGSVASLFYLGNIYGSAVAARIYNAERDARLSDRVEALIDAQSR